jgi:high-affinity K+ transport system ATPase subunit B
VVPSTSTDAPISGSLVFASLIIPFIVPVWANAVNEITRKSINTDNLIKTNL